MATLRMAPVSRNTGRERSVPTLTAVTALMGGNRTDSTLAVRNSGIAVKGHQHIRKPREVFDEDLLRLRGLGGCSGELPL